MACGGNCSTSRREWSRASCAAWSPSAQLDAAAELAVRARRERSRSGEVAQALAAGRLIKTFAFRGATHLLTPEDGGVYLALRAASRMWELPSWQSFYGLTPADWPLLRQAVREALADGPMTRDELGAAVTARPKFRHLGFAFADRLARCSSRSRGRAT
jgi:hypothetical protein